MTRPGRFMANDRGIPHQYFKLPGAPHATVADSLSRA
jgi:hypothetical protein